ncbi:MAG: BrnA antitoxin family protein [Spirochaetes bacterium]|nr:BrnA antitoxin family protein [Spirochaetota bacterium]
MKTNSNKKPIPHFTSEDQEREFWAKNSPLDYMSPKGGKTVIFPNLKPSTKSISIRLPEDMINFLKVKANRMDVPYQSLAKIYLARQIQTEKQIESHGKMKGKRALCV